MIYRIAEFRSNIQKNQKKRAAEQRQKEVQKREAEKENRKNLVGVRVVQKNLVYVTGLTPTVREDELLKTLRQKEFFGQYGNIQKISISNRKSDGHNPSLGIYVTFEKKEDAARCIQAVNGSQNGDRTLRAQLGTTKYCSAWLRHEVCSNRQCMFLHELGDEEDSYTRQDLSSLNSISTQTQRPLTSGAASSSSRSASRQQGHPTPSQQYAQPMARSSSNNGSESGDGPALPATANWARNPQIRSRRGSHATSGAAPSPAMSHSLPVTAEVPQKAIEETHQDEVSNEVDDEPPQAQHHADQSQDHSVEDLPLFKLLKALQDYVVQLPTAQSDYPPLFDSRGWEKRRALRDDEDSRVDVHADETEELPEVSEGEPDGSGSLALGGEPEEGETGRASNDYNRSAAQPPIQRGSTDGIFGPALGSNQTSSYIGSVAGSRTQTPLQQQGFMRGTTGFGENHPPPGLPQAQSSLFPSQGHNRQGSRFSFANDSNNQSQATTVKLAANPRLMAQQSSMMPSTFSAQQSVYQNYPTTMPGPPPGLKSTGTPPAALFGQNQGFSTGNPDLLSLMRGRNTGASGMQGHDAGKREYMFSSFPNQYPPSSTSSTPAPSAPAPGHNLLGQLYGNQPVPGAFQDFGSKQKKKGKKHRHANTSSGGGSALVDLADPSILQARMQQHQQQQQSNAGVGQGLFGGQSQGGYNPNMMYGSGYRGW
jgi:CCR4-NOT transcription complex subunit 4